jgi:hypothetical protein
VAGELGEQATQSAVISVKSVIQVQWRIFDSWFGNNSGTNALSESSTMYLV